MDDEIVLRIPHSLGAAEAQRRIAGGIDAAKRDYGELLRHAETEWRDSRLTFRLATLGQTVRGTVDVEADYVELRAQLPMIIRMLAKRFMPKLRSTGQKLLT